MIIVRFLADLIENTVMKETICLTEEERRQFRADFFFQRLHLLMLYNYTYS